MMLRIAAILSFLCLSDSLYSRDTTEIVGIPCVRLLAQPEAFVGKKVKTSGFVARTTAKGAMLSFDLDSLRFVLAENLILLEPAPGSGKVRLALEKIDRHSVIILKGTFSKSEHWMFPWRIEVDEIIHLRPAKAEE